MFGRFCFGKVLILSALALPGCLPATAAPKNVRRIPARYGFPEAQVRAKDGTLAGYAKSISEYLPAGLDAVTAVVWLRVPSATNGTHGAMLPYGTISARRARGGDEGTDNVLVGPRQGAGTYDDALTLATNGTWSGTLPETTRDFTLDEGSPQTNVFTHHVFCFNIAADCGVTFYINGTEWYYFDPKDSKVGCLHPIGVAVDQFWNYTGTDPSYVGFGAPGGSWHNQCRFAKNFEGTSPQSPVTVAASTPTGHVWLAAVSLRPVRFWDVNPSLGMDESQNDTQNFVADEWKLVAFRVKFGKTVKTNMWMMRHDGGQNLNEDFFSEGSETKTENGALLQLGNLCFFTDPTNTIPVYRYGRRIYRGWVSDAALEEMRVKDAALMKKRGIL